MKRSQGRLKIPVLIDVDFEPMEDADTIAAYIEDTFPEANLSSNATDAGRDLYWKFALFTGNGKPENDAKLRSALSKELGRLNDFLKKRLGAYLDGDHLRLPDCNLLPKLMHVKEAGELKGFVIPQEYDAVLTYLS